MVLLHLGTLILLASVHCQPHKRQADGDDMPGEPENECCDQKMVGDDRYFNIGYDHNGMTMDLNCLSPCIFEKEDQPGSKYCFAAGDMKVECEDDMEFTPTGGPRPTEGEGEEGPNGGVTGGPDGGENGVTNGPNGGDNNGVTGGPDGGDNNGGVTGDGGSCKCGIKKTTRIVGGSETEVNEYPWIAAFDVNGVDWPGLGGCAASLVANNWAVTASHCFYDADGVQTVTKDTMSLVLGVHDLNGTSDTNRKVLTIEEIVIHPSFNHTFRTNDIALLKISESVDLEVWSPACLPTPGADFTGQNGWVYGWGVTSENGEKLADKLLEVEVPIVSDSVCDAALLCTVDNCITSDMFCAGGEEGKDACGGDSGGPLTVADSQSGVHTLVGAVSFGFGCGREGLYGVYANIPFFRTWMDQTIAAKGGATFCS